MLLEVRICFLRLLRKGSSRSCWQYKAERLPELLPSWYQQGPSGRSPNPGYFPSCSVRLVFEFFCSPTAFVFEDGFDLVNSRGQPKSDGLAIYLHGESKRRHLAVVVVIEHDLLCAMACKALLDHVKSVFAFGGVVLYCHSWLLVSSLLFTYESAVWRRSRRPRLTR